MTYFGTRLSENISRREPEGYLICLNVPVARTGMQEYLPSELGISEPDSRLIPVYRPEEEVFSPACIASFEGMPVTDDHPSTPDGVTAENSRFLLRGHAQHVRRGTGDESDLLLADLMITDPVLIDEILAGKREISCGYTYSLCEEDGRFIQREIRGNHVAVVDSGRAGPRVSIRDQEPEGAAAKAMRTSASDRPASGPPVPASALSGRPPGAFTPCAPGTPGFPLSHGQTNDHSERSNPMKKKSLWRAKLMARMAKDGDVDGLAEIITEMMEEPAPAAAVVAVPADPVLPAGDPLVSAVASAVAENLEPTLADEETPAEPAAPVVVETPVEQPVLIDCGPQILEALNQIIALLSAPAADCGTAPRSTDEDPSAVTEAVAETAAEELAENVAAAAVEALAETVAPELASEDEDDPVEELVAEILETGDPADPADPASDEEEEILSSILDPAAADEGDPEGENPEEETAAADSANAIRAAMAPFRAQLKRMSPKQRQRFNADVAARMKKLSRKHQAKSSRPNAYAALRRAAVIDGSGRALGQKIMASRNANFRR